MIGIFWIDYDEREKSNKKENIKKILWPITIVIDAYNGSCPRGWEFELYENALNMIFKKNNKYTNVVIVVISLICLTIIALFILNTESTFHYLTEKQSKKILTHYNVSCENIDCAIEYCNKYKLEVNSSGIQCK